jgi:hypothetical protein
MTCVWVYRQRLRARAVPKRSGCGLRTETSLLAMHALLTHFEVQGRLYVLGHA